MEHYHLFKKLKGSNWDWFDDSDNRLYSEIQRIYDTEQWKPIMEILVHMNMTTSKKALITKDSYRLAKKIKENTDIDVFPAIVDFISDLSPKWNGIAGRCFLWLMGKS